MSETIFAVIDDGINSIKEFNINPDKGMFRKRIEKYLRISNDFFGVGSLLKVYFLCIKKAINPAITFANELQINKFNKPIFESIIKLINSTA
jgi:hypothetical protein